MWVIRPSVLNGTPAGERPFPNRVAWLSGGLCYQSRLMREPGGYDPILWVYWKGISDDSARCGDQLIIDFLCAAFGGPVHYAGRI